MTFGGLDRLANLRPMDEQAAMAEDAPPLLLATRNRGKVLELSALLVDAPFTMVSLAEAGVDEDVDEPGATLEENASHKATTYARLSGLPALADDSGLEVEALGGEPGPLSSRYAGPDATDADRIAFLLRKLENIPEEDWTARFRCVVAVAWPHGPVELFAGECKGKIIRESRGSNGFGYDPIFFLPDMGKTMAQLTPEEKNRISHRSAAARKAVAALRQRDGSHGT